MQETVCEENKSIMNFVLNKKTVFDTAKQRLFNLRSIDIRIDTLLLTKTAQKTMPFNFTHTLVGEDPFPREVTKLNRG